MGKDMQHWPIKRITRIKVAAVEEKKNRMGNDFRMTSTDTVQSTSRNKHFSAEAQQGCTLYIIHSVDSVFFFW